MGCRWIAGRIYVDSRPRLELNFAFLLSSPLLVKLHTSGLSVQTEPNPGNLVPVPAPLALALRAVNV